MSIVLGILLLLVGSAMMLAPNTIGDVGASIGLITAGVLVLLFGRLRHG